MPSPESTGTNTLIADYLRQRFPVLSGISFDDATPLLSDGIIDSLGILDLAMFLGERLGIEISDEDFEPGNFQTFGQLLAFVERKRL
jgi:acyl carrier protein